MRDGVVLAYGCIGYITNVDSQGKEKFNILTVSKAMRYNQQTKRQKHPKMQPKHSKTGQKYRSPPHQ